jgi:hypothetical protein
MNFMRVRNLGSHTEALNGQWKPRITYYEINSNWLSIDEGGKQKVLEIFASEMRTVGNFYSWIEQA